MINSATRTNLSGKKIVFTGLLDSMSRAEAADKVAVMGGMVRSHVGRDIDYVVAGSEAGSRMDKALELGVSVLDEAAFLALLV